MVTKEEIIEIEQTIVLCDVAVRKAQRLHRENSRGQLSDYWGTLGVNACSLRNRLNELIKTLGVHEK